MGSLLELSHELLHCILVEIDARDLSAVSATCRTLNNYIRGNSLLHKDIYSRHWDMPLHQELDWEQELHDLVKLDIVLRSSRREVKESYFRFVADRVDSLIKTAVPECEQSLNIEMLTEHFQDTGNIDAFLAASSLFEQAGSDRQQAARSEELQQLSAKLHCLYGVPLDEVPSLSYASGDVFLSPSACTRFQTRPHLVHTYARSRVYDLRNYTDQTLWGPFMADGSQRVDWEKVEAIMVVLGHNFKTFSRRTNGTFPVLWKTPFFGATPNSYMNLDRLDEIEEESSSEEEVMEIGDLPPSLDSMDPYGVTGERLQCFTP